MKPLAHIERMSTLPRRAVAIGAVLAFTQLVSCDRDRGQVAPTPPPNVTAPSPAPSPPAEFSLSGVVFDNVNRLLAGARVEVMDGARAGASAVTDSSGAYALPGVFTETITLRASREGYLTASRTFPPSRPWGSGHFTVSFLLDTHAIDASGDYTATLTADSACTALPAAARSRAYQATMTPVRFLSNAYHLILSGAPFYPHKDRFLVSVAGDAVRFSIDPYDFVAVEQLTPSTTLSFWGASRVTTFGPRISVPFDGELQHCDRALGLLERFPFVSCALPVTSCTSSSHYLTLTHR